LSSALKSLSRALRAEFIEPHCAYCRSPEKLLGIHLEVDHIIPESEGGETQLDNLCLCCRSCNGFKWNRISGRDPETGKRVRLFHPRRQKREAHFERSKDRLYIVGLTASGRATVEILRMNNDLIVNLRRLWVILGLHPTV
jgi:hypothetical protein